MRVAVIHCAGADWPDWEVVAPGRCELWLRPGLVSLRGHLGLSGASQLPFPSPLCPLLAEQIALRWGLAAGSGADRRWKRKWDPHWERQFFGGRVCFNAGLSCTAALAHCYRQHWSLERCLTLPRVSFRTPSCLLCAEHSPRWSHSETQQLWLFGGANLSHCLCPLRQSMLLPASPHCQPTLPAFLCCSLPAHTASLPSSWASSLACPPCSRLWALPSPVIAQQHLFALLFTPPVFYGGGSVFALRECFWAVARAEEWQMGGDERIRSVMNLFFLPCLKLPVKIQQPHLRSA